MSILGKLQAGNAKAHASGDHPMIRAQRMRERFEGKAAPGACPACTDYYGALFAGLCFKCANDPKFNHLHTSRRTK